MTNPFYMELKDECIASVLEIKHTLVEITKDAEFSEKDADIVRAMITACNTYLDSVRPNSVPHLIYKCEGDWEDAIFSRAMKDFRNAFKEAIAQIEKNHRLKFNGHISDKY